MPSTEAFVARTAADQQGVNTLVVLTYPVRFQLAPGFANGIGISGAAFVVSANGVEIARGQTDANGEVPIPIAPLFVGPVEVAVLGTTYAFSFHPQAKAETLAGIQQLLDKLGYVNGYQLVARAAAQPDDGKDGPMTQQSIMNFQCDENLVLDGVIGPTSRSLLVARTAP